MVYLYKKKLGNKAYFYLRASVKKKGKTATKDILYLGGDLDEVREKIKNLPKKYSKDIRKAYRTINKFLESNHFLQQIKSLKIKEDKYMGREDLEKVEACRLHWQKKFSELDNLTKQETLKNFIIEYAFNTTSIEGNTITLKEAESLLMENKTPKNKTLREIYDVQNTEKVFFQLFGDLNKEIDHKFTCEIHDSLLENIDIRKGYRTEEIKVFKARFKSTPAEYVRADMELLLKWYRKNKDRLHPFVLAAIFHHKLEKIHPFMDGNGRTGRMLMNYILLSKGYPPIIIRKRNRAGYIAQLSSADKCEITKSDPVPYKGLINFNTREMDGNYWNIFL